MQRRRASNEKKERAIDRLKECDEVSAWRSRFSAVAWAHTWHRSTSPRSSRRLPARSPRSSPSRPTSTGAPPRRRSSSATTAQRTTSSPSARAPSGSVPSRQRPRSGSRR
jgi:hypothetical protein